MSMQASDAHKIGTTEDVLGPLRVEAWASNISEQLEEHTEDDRVISQHADKHHFTACLGVKHITLQIACLVLVATVAIALTLLAAHGTQTDHWIVYVFDCFVILFFVGYIGMRCCHLVGPSSLVPVSVALVWLLCLLLSLSPPSRRWQLLQSTEERELIERCEEGCVAFWIGLLLVLVAALGLLDAMPMWLLGQGIALQHILIELALPRPACRSWFWIPALQLSLLAALLASMRPSTQSQRCLTEYLIRSQQQEQQRSSDSQKVLLELERVVEEIELEEVRCWELFSGAMSRPVAAALLAHPDWFDVARYLADVLQKCRAQLKTHSSVEHVHQKLNQKAMEAASKDSEAAVSAVSAFVQGCKSTFAVDGMKRMSPFSRARSLSEYSEDDVPLFPTANATTGTSWGRSLSSSERASLKIGRWNFDAMKVEQDYGHVIQVVGRELLRKFSFLSQPTVAAFLAHLEQNYEANNPYHSHIHAADMANSFYFLMLNSGIWQLPELPDALCVSMVLASLGHDVGHFARNNLFLINQRHVLAVTYNDRSVLENFHAASLTRMLDQHYGAPNAEAKVLQTLSVEELTQVRQMIISLILATDTQKHLEDLAAFRMRLGAGSLDVVGDLKDRLQAISMLFRSADIGHSAKSWDIHVAWSIRAVQEFHEQGDEEMKLGLKVSPLCDRADFNLASSQIGFIQFICLPTWTELARFEEVMRPLLNKHVQKAKHKMQETAAVLGAHALERTNTHQSVHLVRQYSHLSDSQAAVSSFPLSSTKLDFIGDSPGKLTAAGVLEPGKAITAAHETSAAMSKESGAEERNWSSEPMERKFSPSSPDRSWYAERRSMTTLWPSKSQDKVQGLFEGRSTSFSTMSQKFLGEVKEFCEQNLGHWKAQQEEERKRPVTMPHLSPQEEEAGTRAHENVQSECRTSRDSGPANQTLM